MTLKRKGKYRADVRKERGTLREGGDKKYWLVRFREIIKDVGDECFKVGRWTWLRDGEK